MFKKLGLLIICSTITMGTHANQVSSIQTKSTFSPADIQLNILAEPDLPGATYTVFYRQPFERRTMDGWKTASEWAGQAATTAVFKGDHKNSYQFRSMVSSSQGEEMTVIGDFDLRERIDLLWLKSMIPDFRITVKADKDCAIQGERCWIGKFSYDKEKFPDDLDEKALFAAAFTQATPVRDWSQYRYLEFYYYSDTPSLNLYIKSASQELNAPVLRFNEFFDEGPNGWYSIVVDLDKHLGKPEERKKVDIFALTTPIEKLEPQHEYTIRMDGVRLWKTRNFVNTIVDTTPPTIPENIQYELNGDHITWTWTPCEDKESGIEGYTFLLTQDRRIPVPMKILTKEPMISIPFTHPQVFERWHFIVQSQNRAGVWSSKNTRTVDFIPGKTDKPRNGS